MPRRKKNKTLSKLICNLYEKGEISVIPKIKDLVQITAGDTLAKTLLMTTTTGESMLYCLMSALAWAAEKSPEKIPEIAVNKAKSLEGSAFIDACRKIYPDVKYPWECWNRGCCKFSYYAPV